MKVECYGVEVEVISLGLRVCRFGVLELRDLEGLCNNEALRITSKCPL